MSQLPPGLRERVLASRSSTPAAPPGAWGRRRALALAFVALWTTLGIFYWEMRDDWARLPAWYRAASVALIGGTGLGLMLLALSRGRYMVGPGVRGLRAASVALPLLTLAWVAFFAYPTSPPGSLQVELSTALHCHGVALLTAAPALGLLLWLRRGLTQPAPGLLGACLGASTAAWAHVVLFTTCPAGGPVHASFGHALPVLPLMLLGALVGHRAFR